MLLYLPHGVEKIYLKSYDKEDTLVEETTIKDFQNWKVALSNSKTLYYKLSLSKEENSKNTIQFYVLKKE